MIEFADWTPSYGNGTGDALTPEERLALSDDRSKACPDCHMIHAGECF